MTVDDKTTYVVISYFPLLDPSALPGVSPGQYYDIKKEDDVRKIFGDWTEGRGHVEGCLWILDGDSGKPYPIFVIKGAPDINDHLRYWSEGDVEGWFELAIGEYDGQYGMALMPRLSRSIERFRDARRLLHGEDIPTDADFKVMFEPLLFISEVADTFHKLRGQMEDPMKLYLIDHWAMDFDNPVKTNFEKNMVEVGEFSVKWDSEYIQQVLRERENEAEREADSHT